MSSDGMHPKNDGFDYDEMDKQAIVMPRPGRYFIGVWWLADSPVIPNSDWLATAFREKEDPPNCWHLRYRHKYYNSPSPHDPEDRRSEYRGSVSNQTEMQVIRKMEQLVDAYNMIAHYRERQFVRFGTDNGDDIIAKMHEQPWAHFRQDKP